MLYSEYVFDQHVLSNFAVRHLQIKIKYSPNGFWAKSRWFKTVPYEIKSNQWYILYKWGSPFSSAPKCGIFSRRRLTDSISSRLSDSISSRLTDSISSRLTDSISSRLSRQLKTQSIEPWIKSTYSGVWDFVWLKHKERRKEKRKKVKNDRKMEVPQKKDTKMYLYPATERSESETLQCKLANGTRIHRDGTKSQ